MLHAELQGASETPLFWTLMQLVVTSNRNLKEPQGQQTDPREDLGEKL